VVRLSLSLKIALESFVEEVGSRTARLYLVESSLNITEA